MKIVMIISLPLHTVVSPFVSPHLVLYINVSKPISGNFGKGSTALSHLSTPPWSWSHHHHHHHRLTSFFRATARIRRFTRMPVLHTARSCVNITLSFKLCHVFFNTLSPCLAKPTTASALYTFNYNASACPYPIIRLFFFYFS